LPALFATLRAPCLVLAMEVDAKAERCNAANEQHPHPKLPHYARRFGKFGNFGGKVHDLKQALAE